VIRKGELDRRVAFQRVVMVENTLGEEVGSWLPYITRWTKVARAAPPGARPAGEAPAAARLEASAPATFTILWSTEAAAIAPLTHRIVFEDVIWDIHSNTEIGRRQGREIVAVTNFKEP
jgi:head-tail adaptor